MKNLFLLILIAFSTTVTFAQSNKSEEAIPKVLTIGENEGFTNRLSAEFPKTLLSASGNDVDLAFRRWMNILQEIQNFSNKSGFDIKGSRMWLNIYFQADGSIKHIAYYLQPTSRNIPEPEMKGFFSAFINQYKPKFNPNLVCGHSGSASFPLNISDFSDKK